VIRDDHKADQEGEVGGPICPHLAEEVTAARFRRDVAGLRQSEGQQCDRDRHDRVGEEDQALGGDQVHLDASVALAAVR
jgi:hypothetical protein